MHKCACQMHGGRPRLANPMCGTNQRLAAPEAAQTFSGSLAGIMDVMDTAATAKPEFAQRMAENPEDVLAYADDIRLRTGVDVAALPTFGDLTIADMAQGYGTVAMYASIASSMAATATGAVAGWVGASTAAAASASTGVGIAVSAAIIIGYGLYALDDWSDCDDKADKYHEKYKKACHRIYPLLGTEKGTSDSVVIWFRLGEMAPVACESARVKKTITWANHADGDPGSKENQDRNPLVCWGDGSKGKRKGVNERLRYEHCQKAAVMKAHTKFIETIEETLAPLRTLNDRRFAFEQLMLLYLRKRSHAYQGLSWGAYQPEGFIRYATPIPTAQEVYSVIGATATATAWHQPSSALNPAAERYFLNRSRAISRTLVQRLNDTRTDKFNVPVENIENFRRGLKKPTEKISTVAWAAAAAALVAFVWSRK